MQEGQSEYRLVQHCLRELLLLEWLKKSHLAAGESYPVLSSGRPQFFFRTTPGFALTLLPVNWVRVWLSVLTRRLIPVFHEILGTPLAGVKVLIPNGIGRSLIAFN